MTSVAQRLPLPPHGLFGSPNWEYVAIRFLIVGMAFVFALLLHTEFFLFSAFVVGLTVYGLNGLSLLLNLTSFTPTRAVGVFTCVTLYGTAIPTFWDLVINGQQGVSVFGAYLDFEINDVGQSALYVLAFGAVCELLSIIELGAWRRAITDLHERAAFADSRGPVLCSFIAFVGAISTIYGALFFSGAIGLSNFNFEGYDSGRMPEWAVVAILSYPSTMFLCGVSLVGARRRGWFWVLMIAIFICVLFGLSTGRRTLIFGIILLVVGYLWASGTRVRVMYLVPGLAALLPLVDVLFSFFLRLRNLQNDLADRGISSTFLGLIQSAFSDPTSGSATSEAVWQNVTSRGYLLGQLTDMMINLPQERVFGGLDVLMSSLFVIPSAFWPDKTAYLSDYGSPEFMYERAVGLPQLDLAWGFVFGAWADFGWFGILIMPALVLGLSSLTLWIIRISRSIITGVVALSGAIWMAMSVETGDFIAALGTIRNDVLVWIILSIFSFALARQAPKQ